MAGTIGQQLQQARKQRGVSIEQAAQATRVRVFYLEALEKDNQSALPSKAQGRGFLRLYAGYLGLDPAPLLAAWEGKPASDRVFRRVAEEGEELPAASDKSSQSTEVSSETVPAPGEQSDKSNGKIPTVSIPERESSVRQSQDQVVARPVTQPPIAATSGKDKQPSEKTSQPPALLAPLPASPPSRPGRKPVQTRTESQAILEEIGQQLRQQREFLGLSLTEIEKYTRLRLHYLKALENGSMDDLPSTVQARGMLNNYANFLNLNSDALLLRYADALQLRRVERLGAHKSTKSTKDGSISPVTREIRGPSFTRRLLTPDLIIGGALVIGLVLFVLWGASQIMTIQNNIAAYPTLPPVSEVLMGSPSPVSGTSTPGASEETGIPGTPDETPVPGAATLSLLEMSGTSTPGNPTPGSGGQGPVYQFTPPSGDAPIQVYVVARQSSWMRVTVDETVAFQGRVQPGNAYNFTGNNKVELLAGSAAALQVFYNQHDLGALGLSGQVVQLIFNAQGQVKPSATTVPSPTPTLPATPTPREGSVTPTVSPSPSLTPTGR